MNKVSVSKDHKVFSVDLLWNCSFELNSCISFMIWYEEEWNCLSLKLFPVDKTPRSSYKLKGPYQHVLAIFNDFYVFYPFSEAQKLLNKPWKHGGQNSHTFMQIKLTLQYQSECVFPSQVPFSSVRVRHGYLSYTRQKNLPSFHMQARNSKYINWISLQELEIIQVRETSSGHLWSRLNENHTNKTMQNVFWTSGLYKILFSKNK